MLILDYNFIIKKCVLKKEYKFIKTKGKEAKVKRISLNFQHYAV